MVYALMRAFARSLDDDWDADADADVSDTWIVFAEAFEAVVMPASASARIDEFVVVVERPEALRREFIFISEIDRLSKAEFAELLPVPLFPDSPFSSCSKVLKSELWIRFDEKYWDLDRS